MEATVVIEVVVVVAAAAAVAVVTTLDRVEVDVVDIDQFQTKHRLLHTSATCQRALYRVISNRYSALYR